MSSPELKLAKTLTQNGIREGSEERFDCPLCDDVKQHLYYNPTRQLYHCFKCGAKGYFKRAKTVKTPIPASENLLKPFQPQQIDRVPGSALPITGATPLKILQFLKGKGVSAKASKNFRWETMGAFYKLYAPIFFQNEYKGFQARFISNSTLKPYMKYVSARGFRKSKCLYNYDNIRDSEQCVIAEGAFDCFRLPNTVAVFGKSVSEFQLRCIASSFKEVLVALDKDCKWDEIWVVARKLTEMGVMVDLMRYLPSGYNSPGDLDSVDALRTIQVTSLLDVGMFPAFTKENGFNGIPLLKTKWAPTWKEVI